MSTFLVEDKTIHKIINILDLQIRKSPWLKNKFREELGIDFEDYDKGWKTKLGQKMWDLNQLSLGYRYGDDKQEHVYRFSPVLCTPVQAYKAMQCWLYQCCEGKIPEESKLYKFFDDVVIKHAANLIITSMPAYENAEWG